MGTGDRVPLMSKPTQPKFCLKHENMYLTDCTICEMERVNSKEFCYRCGATEDLSKKNKYLLICKYCRNAVARQYRIEKLGSQANTKTEKLNMDEWMIKSKESHSRLVNKYAKA